MPGCGRLWIEPSRRIRCPRPKAAPPGGCADSAITKRDVGPERDVTMRPLGTVWVCGCADSAITKRDATHQIDAGGHLPPGRRPPRPADAPSLVSRRLGDHAAQVMKPAMRPRLG